MRTLLLVIMAAVAGCSSPESFEEITPDIIAAKDQGQILLIEAKQTLVTEGLAMAQLGGLVGQIAEGVQSGFPQATPDQKWARIQLSYSSQDKLGNEGSIDAGTITLPIADLRAAKADNLNGTMWLALVDNVSIGPGGDVMVTHCADPENFVSDREFCSAVSKAVQ